MIISNFSIDMIKAGNTFALTVVRHGGEFKKIISKFSEKFGENLVQQEINLADFALPITIFINSYSSYSIF